MNNLTKQAIIWGLVWGTVQGIALLNTDSQIDFTNGVLAGLWLAMIVELLRIDMRKRERRQKEADHEN